MAEIQAVIFDLGNVVLFFSHDRMCRQLGRCFGLQSAEVHECLFATDFVSRYDRGLATTQEMFELLGSRGGVLPDVAEARAAAGDIFEVNVALEPVLEELKSRGMTLVALSNTCEVHTSHVARHFDVLQRFDRLVLSHEVGFTKPSPEIYGLAVQAAGCPPSSCYFTDDVPEYVEAARSCGLDAEVFVDADQTVAALRARGSYGASESPGRQQSGS